MPNVTPTPSLLTEPLPVILQARIAQADGYFLQKVIRLQYKACRVVKFCVDVARRPAAAQLRTQVIGQTPADAKLGQAVKDEHLERKPGPIDAAVGRVYACELVRQRNLRFYVLRIREDRDATAKIKSFVSVDRLRGTIGKHHRYQRVPSEVEASLERRPDVDGVRCRGDNGGGDQDQRRQQAAKRAPCHVLFSCELGGRTRAINIGRTNQHTFSAGLCEGPSGRRI